MQFGDFEEKDEKELRQRKKARRSEKRKQKLAKKKDAVFEKEMKSMMRALEKPQKNFQSSDDTKADEFSRRTHGLLTKEEFQAKRQQVEQEAKEREEKIKKQVSMSHHS
mmetsp:Transcript_3197/g.4516  ORF Transcript_3197/g.4516 Transcript_3197/m.4516 type:complete len:109 (+) Transcript_3197:115-441(+)